MLWRSPVEPGSGGRMVFVVLKTHDMVMNDVDVVIDCRLVVTDGLKKIGYKLLAPSVTVVGGIFLSIMRGIALSLRIMLVLCMTTTCGYCLA